MRSIYACERFNCTRIEYVIAFIVLPPDNKIQHIQYESAIKIGFVRRMRFKVYNM